MENKILKESLSVIDAGEKFYSVYYKKDMVLDRPIYITDEPFDLINRCKREDSPVYRIFIEKTKSGKSYYYFVDALSNIIHADMYFIVHNRGLSPVDSIEHIQDDQYVIFVPRGKDTKKLNWDTELGYDEYIAERVVEYGQYYVRDTSVFDSELFSYIYGTIRTCVVNYGDVILYYGDKLENDMIEETMDILDFRDLKEKDKDWIFTKERLGNIKDEVDLDDIKLKLTPDGYEVKESISFLSNVIDIPSSYNGVPVTSIGDGAFKDCDYLIEVIIPSTVKSIGERAFVNCESIETIELPNKLTKIGSYAFYNCNSLKSITIPKGVDRIYKDTFAQCDSLQYVSLLCDDITEIDEFAFIGCSKLVDVFGLENVKSLESGVFDECVSLRSIKIPNRVTILQSSLFSGCSSLKNITFPDGLKEIHYGVFQWCKSIESVKLPSSVNSLSSSVYTKCDKLKIVDLSETNIKFLFEGTFIDCMELEEIKLPNTLIEIKDKLYKDCPNMRTLSNVNPVLYNDYIKPHNLYDDVKIILTTGEVINNK